MKGSFHKWKRAFKAMSKFMKRMIRGSLVILSIGLLIGLLGLDNALTTLVYTIEDHRIERPVTIAIVADFHSCYYGQGQEAILEAIALVEPDVVLLPGDIVDDRLDRDNAQALLRSLGQVYPCYYVSGNHEVWGGDLTAIKAMVEGYGLTVLSGESHLLEIKDQQIQLMGIDDPDVGELSWQEQVEVVKAMVDHDLVTILMSHRPERVEAYRRTDADVIVAGHAHGGQWRLPGIMNGFLAPDQGFFPKYAGGLYDLGDQWMVVSRGLARESTRVPRLYNPPELTVLQIE